MKISQKARNTIADTKPEFQCDFCNRSFQKETTMITHLCEQKRRWQDRDLAGNRIGFQTWMIFYKKNTNKKQLTYIDFSKSSYYLAFVKFGHYCVDIKAINVNSYVNWLLDNKIKIDSWCSDTNYNKFLVQYLKDEDPFDAVARSIESMINLSTDAGIQNKDCLRYLNRNRLVQIISNGKISPWVLFNSESGIQFLESLDDVQQKYILDYINPEQWTIKFKRNPDIVLQVKDLLKVAGY